MNTNRKLLMIGVDQAIPFLLKKYLNQGDLPNIKKLYEGGIYTEGLSSPPCDTPTNWTTIATGAPTAIHGATSFYVHVPGEPFEKGLEERSRSQLSAFCQAEYIWDVADRSGMIPFVTNYPGGWPREFRKGGMAVLAWPVPEALPRILNPKSIQIFSQEADKKSKNISPAKNDREGIASQLPILEFPLRFSFSSLEDPVQILSYLIASKENIYDTVVIPSPKDKQNYQISQKSWSNWISIDLETTYGTLPCLFKAKIVELDKEGHSLKIRLSPLYNTQGWTTPPSLGEDLVKEVLSYDLNPHEDQIEYKISDDVASYLQYAQKETDTIGKAIKFAKERLNWSMCFFHVHLLDSVNHKELAKLMKSSPIYTDEKAQQAEDNVRNAYKIVDGLVGYLMEHCVDEDTIVAFLSDHGAMPAWKIANIPSTLMKAGLLAYKWRGSQSKYIVNWKKTYAFPYLEPPFIWVNKKGRDPHGIVSDSEYESIRDQIIDVLYSMRDPETGDRVVKLALKKEDAGFIGLNGERIGDVVYFLNPPYEIYDEVLEQLNPSQITPKYMAFPEIYDAQKCFGAHAYYLPTEKFGDYSNSVPLIFYGPGFQKDVQLKRTINLVDIAPTFSHLLGIPRPKDSLGRVLHEALDL